MRRMTYFVMALALVLGFTQCKKEQPTTQNETQGVRITLYVEDSGNKHEVVPGTGAVNFEDSDVIYVGNGSTYIGTLTRDEDVFSGNITEPADGTKIYFYFVGGLTTDPADLSGQSSFTVNISDQTTKLPVLSLNQATYHTGVTDYSCELKNQCGLVKFRTNVASGTVSVGGMNTVATITFGSNTITAGTPEAVSFATDGDGNGWAILLMQDGVDEATVTADGYFDGQCDVPEITRNMWYNEGVEVSLEPKTINLSEVSGDKTIQDGYTVTGTLGANVQISIADGATVTLDGVNITNLGNNCNWAGINCPGDATIILKDGSTNTVCAGRDGGGYNNYPGIWIAPGKKLTIKGGGQLTAYSNNTKPYGAGIGGGYKIPCGNIEIQGGDINATGGIHAAGIGGGEDASCGTITISGGIVTATGGDGGAGIGSGIGASCDAITISGGTVTATGGDGAAGIGSGRVGSANCGAITISGGDITATGGKRAAGIGSGNEASCDAITITSDVTKVTATKGDDAPNSIGAGDGGSCGTVTIGGVDQGTGVVPNQSDGRTYVYEP